MRGLVESVGERGDVLIKMKKLQNNQKFQWIGESVSFQKSQKRGNKVRYEAFGIGSLKIGIGDFVLVRNDDSLDPEDILSSYVAQVKDLFDTGDECDPYQAQVQWFSRILELPAHAIRSLRTAGHEYEVVQDKRTSWCDVIDAETIFQKCEVLFVDTEIDPEALLAEYIDHPYPTFFCRYVFSGISLVKVKNKDNINKFQKPSYSEDTTVTNGFALHSDKEIENYMTPEKRSYPKKKESIYCAIPTGSPQYPKVLIKKIDDKVLESNRGNVRIFVADPNIGKVDDVTNIVLNKLKLEKEQLADNSIKKPIIHKFSHQNKISPENFQPTNGEVVSDDSSMETETIETPESHMFKNKSAALRNKSCKKLFAYSTRSSPMKNPDMCSTRNSKAKAVHNLNGLNYSSEDEITENFSSKLKLEKDTECYENLEKKSLIHSLSFQNNNVEETKLEINNVCEATPHTPKSKRSFVSKKPKTPLNNNSNKKTVDILLRSSPNKYAAVENSDTDSTSKKKALFRNNNVDDTQSDINSECETLPRAPKSRRSFVSKKPTTPLSNKLHRKAVDTLLISPNKYAALENSDTDSTPKKKALFRNNSVKDTQSDINSECEAHTLISRRSVVNKKPTTPSNNKSHIKTVETNLKSSPNKNTPLKNSDAYSTPKKKAKFADVIDDFRLTRSGRRVKPVNYAENIMEVVSTATPTKMTPTKMTPKKITSTKKKMPGFVRNDCVDDSDSDRFSPEEDSSDNSSVSAVSMSEEESPSNKKKSVTKSKTKSRSKKEAGVRVSLSKKMAALCIPERKTALRTPKNALEESRQRLHVSAVPDSLPCREDEYSDIYSFVKGCLCAQTGGCMYISGVPGTGKTATVHEVVRNLEEEKESGEVPIFTFVEVNGMWMTDPYQCYVQIFKALTGKSIAPQQAADLLEKRFTERGPKKDAVILLVDELDRLWTRKQTVMYNIFDWPTKKNSKLIVLAIANTMDLPERMMMNRISSRLGLTRKTFQPYTFKQLQEIILSRIQELKVFDPDAVQLVARKVAAVSGDARRALDICRFATETVKVGHTPKKSQKVLIGMEQVDLALQQMFSSPVISAIRSSSKMTKLFFQCLLSEFTRSGLEETTLLKVHRQVVSTCRFEGFQPPNSTETSRICADLAASHLILVDNFRNDLYMKIRLNVSSDDVTYALTLN